jgi:hypothetical protein
VHGRAITAGFLFLLLAGCGAAITSQPESSPDKTRSTAGTAFDPATAATIDGRVVWVGAVPQVPPFKIHGDAYPTRRFFTGLVRENPNAPIVNRADHGVEQAIVFLRGVSAEKSRPWDHSAVMVEQRDWRINLLQGRAAVRTAFVRRGDEIDMISRDSTIHVLRGRGPVLFSFTFPDRDQRRKRRMTHSGLVELSSGYGYYWMRGYLFVDDHPYYARTGPDGRFLLAQVPPGCYRVVCWLPNWIIAGRDRDPETSLVTRLYFAPPLEWEREIVVAPGGKNTVEFKIEAP